MVPGREPSEAGLRLQLASGRKAVETGRHRRSQGFSEESRNRWTTEVKLNKENTREDVLILRLTRCD